jgi:hypothetical protein
MTPGLTTGTPRCRARRRGYRVVVVEGRVLATPGVVAPVDDQLFARFAVEQEGRAVVAAPGVVGRPDDELNPREVHPDAVEFFGHECLQGRVVHVQPDALARADGLDQLPVLRPHPGQPGALPGVVVVRHGEPGGPVRVPLGGEEKAPLAGRGVGELHGAKVRLPAFFAMLSESLDELVDEVRDDNVLADVKNRF